MPLRCVVRIHDKCLKLETTNVTPLTEATYSRLLEAKTARIALGGAYLHQQQCNLIPQDLDVVASCEC